MSIIIRPIQGALIRDTDFFTKMVSLHLLRTPTAKFTSEGNASKPTFVMAAAKVQYGAPP